jgi:pSer/pThr/pTyr-binding forkhead associated (FHA) protein
MKPAATMIPGFGKQSLVLGSAPGCDVLLQGEGVAPEHARILHQGGGALTFIAGPGHTTANGRPLTQGEQVPFDFRTQFVCGRAPVPLNHRAILLAILAEGQHKAPPGQLVLGRDPARASVVVANGSVSSQHATLLADRLMIIDHGSTSGTFVGPTKIPPNTPTPLDPRGFVALGPVPFPVELLLELARAANGGVPLPAPPAAPAAHPAHPAQPMAQTGVVHAAPSGGGGARKAKTILGHMDFSAGQKPVKSIGRTPDNDIVLSHPQVSSHHALLHQIGGQLFVEDRGSANGTYVRGHRIAPGQKIASRAARRSTSARCRCRSRPRAAARRSSAGGERARSLGGPAALRDRGLEPAARGARSRQPGRR